MENENENNGYQLSDDNNNNNQIALKPKGLWNWAKSHYTLISLTAGVVTGFVALELNLGGFESLAIGAASTTIPKIFEGAAHLIEHAGGRLWSRKSEGGVKTKDYQIGGSVAIKSVRNGIVMGGIAALVTELVAVLDPKFVISKVATLPFLTVPAMSVATMTFAGSVLYFNLNPPKAKQLRLEVPESSTKQTQLRKPGENLNICSGKLLWELTKTAGQGLILTAGAGVTLFFASRQAAAEYVSNQQNPTPALMKLVELTCNTFAMITTVGVLILVQRRDFELDWRHTAAKVPVLGCKETGDEYTGDLVSQNGNQNIN